MIDNQYKQQKNVDVREKLLLILHRGLFILAIFQDVHVLTISHNFDDVMSNMIKSIDSPFESDMGVKNIP